MIAITRYDNPTKATWRGWAWNQMANRLPPGARVMVLAGEAGLDIEHAERRGFELVGVDRSLDCVKNFRKLGGVAVHGELFHYWNLMKPDGIILDMMGGLTVSSWGNIQHLLPSVDACVWNGLRGRDPLFHTFADYERPPGESGCPRWEQGRKKRGKLAFTDFGLHRGKMVWAAHLGSQWWSAYQLLRKARGDATLPRGGACWLPALLRHPSTPYCYQPAVVPMPPRACSLFTERANPQFYEYRSRDGGNRYDSVAFSSTSGPAAPLRRVMDIGNTPRCKRYRRKAAAAKAVLTARRNSR